MRHSNKFYIELTKLLEEDRPFSEIVKLFNEEMINNLKKEKCIFCGKQIIGKGFVVYDIFGEIDYIFCNRECEDKFHDSRGFNLL